MDDETTKTPQRDDRLLHGADEIQKYLRERGIRATRGKIYYMAAKELPIGRLGKALIASTRKLDRALERATVS